ncbi:molybdopterin-containing oxidoreductase family protein [Enterocloster lavalensis]|uniref:molybdopterin-containing oxidoreductase family protein n=1 Tax=Enterocloster lavalensis TaxID=460384 RepID=UPI0023F56E86|nr:molybdopterin-dependent oxidoreductase [Enterocloster lavalensis]
METREELLRAKIPCPETGIEIKRTLCAICSPSFHCGVDAYVRDGRIIKVEGTEGHPMNDGLLCTKGLSNREYIYRKDRILTPLKRVGSRGEGKFQEITWEEAYREIADRLLAVRAQDGADSVLFFGGYSKWFRPWLHRLAFSFGTENYATESSTCFTSGLMAWKVATGRPARPDMEHCGVFLGWAFNPYHSRYLNGKRADEAKARGVKFIIVDPRETPATEKLADIHLRPVGGTDGALALGMANILIENGWIDRDYIERYVSGFEAFAEYVRQFNADNLEALTGVPYEQALAACRLIHENGPLSVNESSAPLAHHKNGMQNYRAIMALTALTGSYDRVGGQRPSLHTYVHQSSGFQTREEEFVEEKRPKACKEPVGKPRFPLWYHLEREAQAMDIARQITEGKPYPIRAVFACGMNARMFPDTEYVKEALKKLDFFVDADLFLTDTAKYADIVLPACSSFERGEFKTYPGGYATYTEPVIPPLGQSKSDADILCELAGYLDLDDPLLRSGYENCVRDIIRDLSVTVEELKAADLPVLVPERELYAEGAYIEGGMDTPSGKFELDSLVIQAHPEWGLDSLPTYRCSLNQADEADYPFILCAGARIPHALHSRLHDVPWLRSLRPEPEADLALCDAERLGIKKGDKIQLFTAVGSIEVKANPTARVLPGMVHMYHGYREADVNSLMDRDNLDPYCGFPGFRSTRCGVRKGEN